MTIFTMIKYFLQTQAFAFLSMIIFGTSCNGQVQKDLPKEKVSESKIIAAGQPKLIKTQGSQKSDNVNSSLQDKAGNLWFGTTKEGLYKYDGKAFTQFTVANGLISNGISSIVEDKDGKLWIGTEDGLCLYDGKTFSKVEIPLRKNLPPNKYRNTHNVFSIMQDKSGKLWFATIDGVYVYDGKSFTPFIIKEDGGGFMSSNHNVEYILEDKAGNIWLGGRNNEGVFRYSGKSITNFKITDQKEWNWAFPALQDKNGTIWFNNWSGAYRFDGKSFTRVAKKDGLTNDIVIRIIEDKKGNLWFGCGSTRGLSNGGICRYDGKTFTCLTTGDSRINNDVWTILEDRKGHLWVGTRNTGLWSYDGKLFTYFTEKDEEVNNSSLLPVGRQ
ncbi:ligand-binding sensor domain-containing protein [Telluribacter humicola]